MDDDQFDGLFYNVMNQARGIDNFFDKCFGFFRRKTDFFLNPESAKKAIDINFGLNQKKFQETREKEEKKKKKIEDDKKKKDLEEELRRRAEATKNGEIPNAGASTTSKPTTTDSAGASKSEPTVREITPEEYERQKRMEQEKKNGTTTTSNTTTNTATNTTNEVKIEQNKPSTSTTTTSTTNTSSTTSSTNSTSVVPSSGNTTVLSPKGVDEEGATTAINPFNDLPYKTPDKSKSMISPNHPCLRTSYGVSLVHEVYTDEHGKATKIYPTKTHGGRMEKYQWGQPRVEENWITIPIDPTCRGKDVKVDADSKHLTITLKGEKYIDRDFFKKINASTFMWIMDENKELGKFVHITFEKLERMNWWEATFLGDPLIDATRINPEATSISECDSSMRPQIEKAMYDTRQKMMGLPTSDEVGGQKNLDAMQKFMAQHPEMDFSKAKFN